MKSKKYYVVWQGRRTGIYESWQDCKALIDGFEGAKYKSFEDFAQAKAALQMGFEAYYKKFPPKTKIAPTAPSGQGIIAESWSVDAACSGNPGQMEYQGVHTRTGEQLFHLGPFPEGTNNIGEFLAIVHAMALMRKQNIRLPIYTDSVTALSWLRRKKVKTNLDVNARTKPLFELIERAENWLRQNPHDDFLVLKWDTPNWGEIPADFGRK